MVLPCPAGELSWAECQWETLQTTRLSSVVDFSVALSYALKCGQYTLKPILL